MIYILELRFKIPNKMKQDVVGAKFVLTFGITQKKLRHNFIK